MTQKKIRGDQLDLTLADGSLLSNVNAALLNGETNAVLHAAANLTGNIADARLNGPYNFDLTGTLTGTADNALELGGSAAALYAKLASPSFSGNPTAPTQTAGNNTTRLATTAFVTTAVAGSGATVTSSGTLAYSGASSSTTWNHGQATMPLLVNVHLICAIAEGGYAIGNVISLNHTLSESDSGSGPQNDGIAVQISTSQVIVRVANRRALSLNTSNGNFQPNTANWNMLIRIIT